MARIVGTSGNDVLRGTSHKDVIIGKGGHDVIIGKGGNDVIRGGDGKDTIKGGGGNDKILGGDGGDTLIGGGGNDTIKGQSGRDTIRGNNGDDDLYGNKGADLLFGAKGADDLWGGTGPDVFRFKAGDGFHDQFPNPPSPPNSFDDVIHDFSGIFDPMTGSPDPGQGDQLDIPNTTAFLGNAFDGGYFVIFNETLGGPEVGSFFAANTDFIYLDDFV